MKKSILICIALFIVLTACASGPVPEPERCALCDDLSRHAPCIINLSTGEKLELDVYEPHPFLVGEIAEKQHGGYFSFVRGAGVEGYKLGAESVTVTIPVKSDKLDQRHFCNACRELLADYMKHGYVLIDLKDTSNPVVYEISDDTSFTLRCYKITAKELKEDKKYEITIIGTLNTIKYSGNMALSPYCRCVHFNYFSKKTMLLSFIPNSPSFIFSTTPAASATAESWVTIIVQIIL